MSNYNLVVGFNLGKCGKNWKLCDIQFYTVSCCGNSELRLSFHKALDPELVLLL